MTAQPPVRPPGPFRFSREQFRRLGDLGFFAGTRVELIRGEIREMSPINWPHQLGKIKLARVLGAAFAGLGWVNEQGPLPTDDSDRNRTWPSSPAARTIAPTTRRPPFWWPRSPTRRSPTI